MCWATPAASRTSSESSRQCSQVQPPAGWIEVSTRYENGESILEIANSGHDLSSEDLDRLLQPFDVRTSARGYQHRFGIIHHPQHCPRSRRPPHPSRSSRRRPDGTRHISTFSWQCRNASRTTRRPLGHSTFGSRTFSPRRLRSHLRLNRLRHLCAHRWCAGFADYRGREWSK